MSLIKIPWKKTFWQRVCESVAKLVCRHLVHHHLFRLAWQTVPQGLVAIRLKYQARQAKVSWFSRCSEIHNWNIPKCDKTRPQREIAHVMTNGCWMKSCRLLAVFLSVLPLFQAWEYGAWFSQAAQGWKNWFGGARERLPTGSCSVKCCQCHLEVSNVEFHLSLLSIPLCTRRHLTPQLPENQWKQLLKKKRTKHPIF